MGELKNECKSVSIKENMKVSQQNPTFPQVIMMRFLKVWPWPWPTPGDLDSVLSRAWSHRSGVRCKHWPAVCLQ